jgi:hypothetical protein
MPRVLAGVLLLLGAGATTRLALQRRSESEPVLLHATPMVGRPTDDSMTLTLIAAQEVAVRVELKPPEQGWQRLGFRNSRPAPVRPPARIVEATLGGQQGVEILQADEYLEVDLQELSPGTLYEWRVRVEEANQGERRGAAVGSETYRGQLVCPRPRGESFRFAVFADSHFFVPALEPRLPEDLPRDHWYLDYVLRGLQWFRQTREEVLEEYHQVAENIIADRPDFVVGLGDHFDLHGLDFNAAFLSPGMAELAHAETRLQLGRLASCGALFQLIGNWEGESGFHAPEHRRFAIEARRRYQVNPRPESSPWPGSEDEDYYAWRWGDVQLIALNVRGYTPTKHLLGGAGSGEGTAVDFTLGSRQKKWLEKTLEESDLPFKLVFIHHAVGGHAGDQENSNYGRGGGQAAQVGEQRWLHEQMLQHGVQVFFYGHDHVFTDLVVDGIHYTLPGTTSAPWRFETEETGYQRYWKDSGHGRVDVTPERLRVEFVNYAGEILHSYEVAAPGS